MASNVNIVVIEGRLTHDPTLMTTRSGKTLCRFSIANNRYYYKDHAFKDSVSFFTVTAWGALGERVSAYLKKGKLVLVNGSLKQESYTAKDGAKKQSVSILAREIKCFDRSAAQTRPAVPARGAYAISEPQNDESVIPEQIAVEW